jgi:8-oxo-dGTP pyrophosphatase MutT (NUDIX family)
VKQFDVVSCLIEWSGRFLFLQRHPKDIFGTLWGIPTGKRKTHESLNNALRREVFEETGLTIHSFEFVHTFYVSHSNLTFEYHLYHSGWKEKPEIRLNSNEHTQYQWYSISEALYLPLVPDMKECLLYFTEKHP